MCRILIAEDEARLAAFVDKGLRKHGFGTAIAEDGEQALQMAASGEFTLLLLDLGLPLKDGWTVLQELRSRGKALIIIIVTALNGDNRTAALQYGANDFLSKPFRFNDLLELVRSHLEQSNQT